MLLATTSYSDLDLPPPDQALQDKCNKLWLTLTQQERIKFAVSKIKSCRYLDLLGEFGNDADAVLIKSRRRQIFNAFFKKPDHQNQQIIKATDAQRRYWSTHIQRRVIKERDLRGFERVPHYRYIVQSRSTRQGTTQQSTLPRIVAADPGLRCMFSCLV